MRTATFVLLGVATATPALAQDFRGGYDLVVRQHPTEVNPEAVVEIWSWTDYECSEGQVVLANGDFRLELSHPVLEPGFTSDVWIDCLLVSPPIPPGPCDTWGSIRVSGTVILPFAFRQVGIDTISYANPLHVMNVHMIVRDLTPRDVEIRTADSLHAIACVADGAIAAYLKTQPVTQG